MSDWLEGLTESLDELLDVEAGLRDVLFASRHQTMVQALEDVLDVEAGLDDILPITDDRPFKSVKKPAVALTAWATEFAHTPVHERILLRSQLPMGELHNVNVIALAREKCRQIGITLARDPRPSSALARSLGGDLADLLSVAFDLDHARDLVRDFTLVTVDLALARDLIRDIDLALAQGLDRTRTRALGRARHADRELDVVYRSFRSLDLALADDLGRKVNESVSNTGLSAAIRSILDAVSDVIDADLRNVDLDGIPLVGLRWSRRTQWPPGWRDKIHSASLEITPGIFEVRGGISDATTALI
jgi:hypothetical protein